MLGFKSDVIIKLEGLILILKSGHLLQVESNGLLADDEARMVTKAKIEERDTNLSYWRRRA